MHLLRLEVDPQRRFFCVVAADDLHTPASHHAGSRPAYILHPLEMDAKRLALWEASEPAQKVNRRLRVEGIVGRQ